MTHDELLEKITDSDDNLNYFALKAVVELHRQFKFSPANTDDFCSHCSRYGDPVIYPCPTIEAIEKELNV